MLFAYVTIMCKYVTIMCKYVTIMCKYVTIMCKYTAGRPDLYKTIMCLIFWQALSILCGIYFSRPSVTDVVNRHTNLYYLLVKGSVHYVLVCLQTNLYLRMRRLTYLTTVLK
jgi:hypothetical protein